MARDRLKRGLVELRAELPELRIEEHDERLEDLSLPPRAGQCAYCGEHSESDEHVWATWISTVLGEVGSLSTTVAGRPRPIQHVPVMTQRVCEPCNNKWLSVMENDVKPLLRPMILGEDQRVLSIDDQCSLATWAYKTALMIDLSRDGVVPVGFHREFAIERSAHECSTVWCGAYSGNSAVLAYSEPTFSDPTTRPIGLLTTFTVFRVVFQVFHHFTVSSVALNDSRFSTEALHQIWPAGSDAISWPKNRLAFGDDDLRELAGSVTVAGSTEQ